MTTNVKGTYEDRPTEVEITDGEVVKGDGEPVMPAARAAVKTRRHVSIPGLWSGAASFDDPWAIRALFSDLLTGAAFSGDEPPSLIEGDPPGVIY